MKLVKFFIVSIALLFSCGKKNKKAVNQNGNADTFDIVVVMQERFEKSGVELTVEQQTLLKNLAETEGLTSMKAKENEGNRAEIKSKITAFRKMVIGEILTDEQRDQLVKSRGNKR